MADALDPYKTLQVDPEAEDEVIQAAYRRLARKYHPDVSPGAEAQARMAAINAAWEMIGDPVARALHDRERAARSGAAGSAAAAAGPAPTTGTPRQGPTGPVTGAPGAGPGSGAGRGSGPAARQPAPDEVSRDWTTGRSSYGGGYDE